jgi:hypothetical protein
MKVNVLDALHFVHNYNFLSHIEASELSSEMWIRSKSIIGEYATEFSITKDEWGQLKAGV